MESSETADRSASTISSDTLRELHRSMLRIRMVEERIASEYPKQEMRCPVHLSIGQEASAVGVCAALKKDDVIFCSHRCHAPYLAKGGSLKKMIAELYGKKTGCTGGRGGSMHLYDPEAGILGTSAILGGIIPIAVGYAQASKWSNNGKRVVVFFGDAAIEEGIFWESMNYAWLHSLPILFVCEDNGLSTSTPILKRQSSILMCGHFHVTCEDNVEEIYGRVKLPRDGPKFIRISVKKLCDHVGPGNESTDIKCINKNDFSEWVGEIGEEIDEAFAFAKESPSA